MIIIHLIRLYILSLCLINAKLTNGGEWWRDGN